MTHQVGPKQRKGNEKERIQTKYPSVLFQRKLRLQNRSWDIREEDSSGESQG